MTPIRGTDCEQETTVHTRYEMAAKSGTNGGQGKQAHRYLLCPVQTCHIVEACLLTYFQSLSGSANLIQGKLPSMPGTSVLLVVLHRSVPSTVLLTSELVHASTHTHTYMYMHMYTYSLFHIFIVIAVYIYMCVHIMRLHANHVSRRRQLVELTERRDTNSKASQPP